jgi:hypothetical protein
MRPIEAMVYVSAHSAWVALVAPVEATAFGPKPPRPKTAGRISWVRSSRAGHKVAAVKLQVFLARCA